MNMSNSITITREEFTKAVNTTIDFLKSQNIEVSQTLFCSYLSDVLFEDSPTSNVQEVKHGKWKLGYCSECGYNWGKDAPIASVPNFCPNCGAKMDGKETEDA
jgi:rubrerythrin